MESIVISALSSLDLSEKEKQFFLISLKLGPATVSQVAKASKLERSTAYLISESLISKGLLEHDSKLYRNKVIAVEPRQLLRMISSKQRKLRRQEIELQENLPGLQAFYSTSGVRPKVRLYEGRNGLLNVWGDILSSRGEILLWTNQETEKRVFSLEDHNMFVQQRSMKKLPIRVLAVTNAKGQKLLKEDEGVLRSTKLLPKKVDFSAETYIYDNKVAILDYTTDIIGVIIQSEQIANAQKAIFELSWNQSA